MRTISYKSGVWVVLPVSIITVAWFIHSNSNPTSNGRLDYLKDQIGTWVPTREIIFESLPLLTYQCLKENEVVNPLSPEEMSLLLSGNNKTRYNYLHFDKNTYLVNPNPVATNGIIEYTVTDNKDNPKLRFQCRFDGKTIYIKDEGEAQKTIRVDYETGKNEETGISVMGDASRP